MPRYNLFIAGGAGLLLGAIGGYFVGKRVTYSDDCKRFDEYYKELDKYYREKIKDLEEENKKEQELRLSEAKDQVNKLNNIKNNMNIVDYSRSLGYSVADSNFEEPRIEHPKISIIDADSFCDDVSYGVMYLTLHPDKTLTDDYSEDLVYPEDSIGTDILENVVGHQNLGDIFYVKNDINRTYYEVSVSNEVLVNNDTDDEDDI